MIAQHEPSSCSVASPSPASTHSIPGVTIGSVLTTQWSIYSLLNSVGIFFTANTPFLKFYQLLHVEIFTDVVNSTFYAYYSFLVLSDFRQTVDYAAALCTIFYVLLQVESNIEDGDICIISCPATGSKSS